MTLTANQIAKKQQELSKTRAELQSAGHISAGERNSYERKIMRLTQEISGQETQSDKVFRQDALDRKAGYPVLQINNQLTNNQQTYVNAKNMDNPKPKFNITPNEFVYNYENPTYSFKWYMCDEQQLMSGPVSFSNNDEYVKKHKEKLAIISTPELLEKIIIAETGVTADMNIRSVDMKTVVSGDKTTANEIVMELFEPYSCSLFDKMYEASLMMGIEDWKTSSSYIVELAFFGKDKRTGQFGQCVFETGYNKNNTWVWRVNIISMDTKVDEGGTVYTIKMIPSDDMLKDRQFITLPIPFKGKAADVSDIFVRGDKSLQYVLNDFYVKTSNPAPNHTYSFTFVETQDFIEKRGEFGIDRTIDLFKIKYSKESSARNENIGIGPGGTFSWSEGTTLDNILKDVQISTPDMQKMIIGKKAVDQPGAAEQVMKFDIRYETGVIVKYYDAVLNDYAKHFIIYIYPYATSQPVVNEKDSEERADKKMQKKRIETLRNKSINKIYSYLYTGKNQDILSFNMDINNLWFASLPKSNNSYDINDNGEILSAAKAAGILDPDKKVLNIAEENSFRSNIKKLDGTLGRLQTELDRSRELFSLDKTIDSSENKLAAASLMNLSENNKLVNSVAIINDTLAGLDGEGKKDSDEYNSLAALRTTFNNELAVLTTKRANEIKKQLPRTSDYLMDLGTSNINKFIKDKTNRIMRIPTKLDVENLANNQNKGSHQTDVFGQQLSVAILNQLYGDQGFLITVDVDIKGDPFWLGPSNLDKVNHIESLEHFTPDFIKRQSLFLFQLRFPKKYNDDTGLMDFDSENIFKGLYNVLTINHKFAEGKFTQTLHSNREVLTDVLDQDEIDELFKGN